MIRTILTSIFLFSTVVLTACSTTQNDPLLEVDNVVSKGVIDNFGSIFVNGIEFKTAGATLHLRDVNADPVLVSEAQVQDFLKKGMVVTVKGQVVRNGTTGTAQEVEFRNTMEASIDAGGVDLVNNTITVLGQKIAVADTVKSLLSSLSAGDVVEISGLPDDKGQIKATFLEKKDRSNRIRGQRLRQADYGEQFQLYPSPFPQRRNGYNRQCRCRHSASG